MTSPWSKRSISAGVGSRLQYSRIAWIPTVPKPLTGGNEIRSAEDATTKEDEDEVEDDDDDEDDDEVKDEEVTVVKLFVCLTGT